MYVDSLTVTSADRPEYARPHTYRLPIGAVQ
jgi:hypothetical protein